MAAPRDVVHQINFGLQQDDGIAVSGGTLSDDDMLFWLRRLQVHLRLQRFGSALPPDRALSTFEFPDGWTAVVRRWSSGGTIGRNDALALLARSAWLPLPVVLGLDQRFGWETAARQRPFQKWDAEQLQSLGEEGAHDLRAPALQLPDLLRRTLERLFDGPEQPLTIVGCPDEQRIPLLWGLHKLAAPRLLQHFGRRLSTFSTYEVEDADSITNLPAIVFLPDRPAGATISRRTLVDVRVDGNVSSASADLARRRVESFLAGREDQPEFDTAPAALPMPSRAAALVGGEPAWAGGPTVPVGASTGEYGRVDGGQTRHPGDDPGQARPGDHGVSPALAAAVARLRQAYTMTDHQAALAEVESLTATREERAALRNWLGPRGYAQLALDIADRLVQPGNHRAFFRRLQEVAFARDRADLRNEQAVGFAVGVMQSRTSPDLGAVVFADLATVRGEQPVVQDLGYRWLNENGLPDNVLREPDGSVPQPTSVAPLAPASSDTGKPRPWWQFPRLWSAQPQEAPQETGGQWGRPPVKPTWWRSPWAPPAIVAAAAILVVGAVIGLSGGGGAGGGGSAATRDPVTATATGSGASESPSSTPTTTTVPVQTPPAAVGSPDLRVDGSVSGKNLVARLSKAAAPEATVVYLLLRPLSTNDFYYYRNQCDGTAEPERWVCRQPTDKPALPVDNSGYDVVLVKVLRGEPLPVKTGLAIVDEPQSGDYVVAPVPVAS